ncbi:MAG: SPASM domain-containing protein [Candidatus Wallbacteria bacterium]|nr:SPASM domain-containing protein [Candidatus Wallbacteria bacterium]
MSFKATGRNSQIPLLILDTIAFCELSCIMCPQSKPDPDQEYRRGIMDFSLYKKIMDELTTGFQKVNAILPFWNGEGPLHPEFKKMVEYAAERNNRNKGFNVFSLHTNFNSLNQELLKTMIDSRIFGPITLSFDALTEETYRKIRIGGDFNRVMNNIHFFLQYRKLRGLQYPSLIFQFIVMPENSHEAVPFRDYWENVLKNLALPYKIGFDDTLHMDCDTIFFRRMNVDTDQDQKRAEDLHKSVLIELGLWKEETERAIQSDEFRVESQLNIFTGKKAVRRPCVGLWQHFGVRYDGEASACCTDFKARQKLGNVKDSGIWAIWTGELLEQYRIWHILGEFHRIPVCAGCRNQAFHSISDEEITAYLKDIQRDDLITKYLERVKQ